MAVLFLQSQLAITRLCYLACRKSYEQLAVPIVVYNRAGIFRSDDLDARVDNKHMPSETIRLSYCICTMNRPDDLRRCLAAALAGQERPDEIIVSNDSQEEGPTQEVVAQFPGVLYQRGPRRGLGANRNACIQRSTGTHILFTDDDVQVAPSFFATARRLAAEADARAIVTGYEIKHGPEGPHKVMPHNADFWGLQRVPVQGEYRAV